MQSCPNCGTHNRPEARICQVCGLPLAAPLGQAPTTPLGQAMAPDPSREFSPNGNAPEALPASPGPSADTPARASHESWGPGTWGPGAPLPGDLPPDAPNIEKSPTRRADQPPGLREYAAPGTAGQGRPYFPPGGRFAPPGVPLAPSPGYPLIPQDGRAPITPGYPVVPGAPGPRAYPPAPAYPPYVPYPIYPGVPGYPYGWYPPFKPPPAPGETYHKVLSIITIVATSLLLLGGLGVVAVLALLGMTGDSQDLSTVNLLIMAALAALAGGGAGLYHAIRALTRRASAPFSLPDFWPLLAATIAVIGASLALFATRQPTGPVALIEPLVLLSGIIPAFTVLALGLQRLGASVSWRRAWLALTSGATLSIGLGGLLELVLAILLLGFFSLSSLDPTSFNPNSPSETIGLLLLAAVIAPVVEETAKQISGFFLLPRIKSPQEAFLIGLASGVGFAIVETAGYIGMAQADWSGIALARVGAGLVHGVGAAMAGLGWYYLIKGNGMRGRWSLGFGCLAYAYLQHAVFNGGSVLLPALFPSLQTWHFSLFDLTLDATFIYAYALYIIILGVLLLMTTRLRRSEPLTANVAAASAPTFGGAMAAPSAAPGTSIVDIQPASAAISDAQGSTDWRGPEPGGRR